MPVSVLLPFIPAVPSSTYHAKSLFCDVSHQLQQYEMARETQLACFATRLPYVLDRTKLAEMITDFNVRELIQKKTLSVSKRKT